MKFKIKLLDDKHYCSVISHNKPYMKANGMFKDKWTIPHYEEKKSTARE
jgi:hypothetical protein